MSDEDYKKSLSDIVSALLNKQRRVCIDVNQAGIAQDQPRLGVNRDFSVDEPPPVPVRKLYYHSPLFSMQPAVLNEDEEEEV